MWPNDSKWFTWFTWGVRGRDMKFLQQTKINAFHKDSWHNLCVNWPTSLWFAKRFNKNCWMTSFMMIWITTGYNLRVARMSKGNIAPGATAKVYHFHIIAKAKPTRFFFFKIIIFITAKENCSKVFKIIISISTVEEENCLKGFKIIAF